MPGASVDRLCPIVEDAGREQPALVLRDEGDDPGALLLGLDHDGFAPLPESIPSIWVTAPTAAKTGLGIAMNAKFDLDAGRAQPAKDSSRNRGQAEALGRRLGGQLVALFDTAETRWDELREALGIAPVRKPNDLWQSLWEVAGRRLAAPDAGGPDGEILRIALWGDADRGMARLATERDALPTGLPGSHAVATRLGRVEHAAGGLLAERPVIEAVVGWPAFTARYRPGTVVGREISRALKGLTGRGTQEVRLAEVVEAELARPGGGPEADPETGRRLGVLIDAKFIRAPRDGAAEGDREALEAQLRMVKFLDRDGQWQPAGELLIADEGPDFADEFGRAAFAPANRVLHDGYDAAGRDFARACRPAQRMNAPVERMATWGWEADKARRRAFLDYLVGPLVPADLVARLREDILARRRAGWIAELVPDSSDLGHLDGATRRRLLANLGLDQPERPTLPPPPPPLDPSQVLRRLHDLAAANRADMVEWYERSTYPGGVRPTWSAEGPAGDVASRQGWLTLFLLGAMHTMGGYGRAQHRGFLEECEQRGWLLMFAEEHREPGEWMGVLDRYLDEKVHDMEYLHWMRQFVAIYQISRWLGPNARNFISLGGWRGDFELVPRLAAREDSLFLPEDAPPLLPVLGHGSNFVLRELARGGGFDPGNQFVHRHLYPAYAGVRRFLSSLGCWELAADPTGGRAERVAESTRIHRFLVEHLGRDRAHFGHTFDLPLLWASEVPEVWAKVMDGLPYPDGIEDDRDADSLEDGS